MEFQRLAPVAPIAPPHSSHLPHLLHPLPTPHPLPLSSTPIFRGSAGDSGIATAARHSVCDMTAMGGPSRFARLRGAKYLAQMDSSVLMAVMVFQGGAVRVKTDFTDNRGRLDEVMLRLIYGDDLDGDGFPDNPETGTAFGQDDAEFNIFNTDRQLSALQTAMSMLRPLPERKTLVYFSSGLRLNGTDNHAQLRATTNAAQRANVSIRGICCGASSQPPPMGDASRPSPGGMQMFTGQGAVNLAGAFQRSRTRWTRCSKDTAATRFVFATTMWSVRRARPPSH